MDINKAKLELLDWILHLDQSGLEKTLAYKEELETTTQNVEDNF